MGCSSSYQKYRYQQEEYRNEEIFDCDDPGNWSDHRFFLNADYTGAVSGPLKK